MFHRGLAWAPLRSLILALPLLLSTWGCGSEPEPLAVSLVDRFPEARVEGTPGGDAAVPALAWSFADLSTPAGADADDPLLGWEAVGGIEGLRVEDGQLVGRVKTQPAFLTIRLPETEDPEDTFHSLEIRMLSSSGGRLGLELISRPELVSTEDDGGPKSTDELLEEYSENAFHHFSEEVEAAPEIRTFTLDTTDARMRTTFPMAPVRHLLIRPTDAVDAEFAIESMRLVTLKEHLGEIDSGPGWQGLGEVFRETIVARSPERVVFPLELPSDPFLDLAIGTVELGPVTFVVELSGPGGSEELLRRTVTTPGRWTEVPVELGSRAGAEVELTLALEAGRPGALGYWGAPVVRNRAGSPPTTEPSKARRAVAPSSPEPPQGVILVVADTLRRDHLQAYGYERDTAPVLTRMAREGVLFRDAISQGTWTKVAVSSIVTSLYPSTHGVRDMPDRMPAGVTTLAEAYRSAGYATFATSSVPFTGRLTNLHQGVEVLHESTSVPELEHSESKTSRTYVDRLVEWIEGRREVPFFALLHVFDPHSPFEPYDPYTTEFLSPEELAEHRRQMEIVREHIESDFMRREAVPNREELRSAGLEVEPFLAREIAWYDASIKAMDVELGRLLEQLSQLGLADRVLIALVADHGEEFLEHDLRFHGYHAYGEMINVPMVLWWPAGLPQGVVVEPTVQAIDLMPTLLELSLLPLPERLQGQSLLPLLSEVPAKLGWRSRPAFAERWHAPVAFSGEEVVDYEQLVVVDGRWKLVRNLRAPEGVPELQLFDHQADPLNLEDVAGEHPEEVERLAKVLDNWHRSALAAKVEAEEASSELSEQELQKLRALGYVD